MIGVINIPLKPSSIEALALSFISTRYPVCLHLMNIEFDLPLVYRPNSLCNSILGRAQETKSIPLSTKKPAKHPIVFPTQAT